MYTINITAIIEAILGLCAALVTYRLIPWIKAHTTEKQQALIEVAIQTAVYAAEQIYGAGHGAEKMNYALAWLHDRGYDADRTRVEAAVYDLLNSFEYPEKKPEGDEDA